jgi:hypothetical protein
VYKKAETLLNEVYPILTKFPKAEKYGLALEIKKAFFGLLRNIMMANNVRSRRRLYQEQADAELKLLFVLFSIAGNKERRYISKGQHYNIECKLGEIGRLLGGWMKLS